MSGHKETVVNLKKQILKLKNNPLECITLLCRTYIFVDNDIEKDKVINDVVSLLENEMLLNIATRVLNKNIMVDSNDVVVSQWIIINSILRSKEYKMIKNGKEYNLEYLNDGFEMILEF